MLDALLDDEPALDAHLAALREPLAPRLVATLAPAAVAAGRAAFEDPTPGAQALVALGRPGAWIATESLCAMLPRQRAMPWPPFERWDALIEVSVKHPEAAWLVADVYAALAPSQVALARRAVAGVDRRFGSRGWRVLRLRAADGPHAARLAREAWRPV